MYCYEKQYGGQEVDRGALVARKKQKKSCDRDNRPDWARKPAAGFQGFAEETLEPKLENLETNVEENDDKENNGMVTIVSV